MNSNNTQTKLSIPVETDAALHIVQADQELTLAWQDGAWKLTIIDTATDIPGERPLSFESVISLSEGAALLYLWGNGDSESNDIVTKCYENLDELLSKIPVNLRPIP